MVLLLVVLIISPSKEIKIGDKTILKISLQGKFIEEPGFSSALRVLRSSVSKQINIWELIDAIKRAQNDPNIKGIYLECGSITAGWAQLTELRKVLMDFKKSGKFIASYSEVYTQQTYYIATVADEIFMHPEGYFLFKGLNMTIPFYKTLFDKLGIKPCVFRTGDYKSFVEPFILNGMSNENRQQRNALLDDIYNNFINSVAEARHLTSSFLKKLAEDLSAILPESIYNAQLITSLGYKSDLDRLLKNKINIESTKSISYVNFRDYGNKSMGTKNKKNQIAVLIAEGEIVDGKSKSNYIGSKDFTKVIKKLKADDSIKAVVLRINSPGGSALASDTIWKELCLLKGTKPIVASMSNVAASGGYYMALACNKIYANIDSLTGSIGVFGLFFDAHLLLKNIGITMDTVKTSKHADIFENIGRPFDDYETCVIQKSIEKTYDSFLSRVSHGRNLTIEEVKAVASGRVWSGKAAKEKKLVDEIGGLDDAIASAAKLANVDLDNCSITYWPSKPTFFEEIMADFKNIYCSKSFLQEVEKISPDFIHFQRLVNMRGIQARIPYDVEIR